MTETRFFSKRALLLAAAGILAALAVHLFEISAMQLDGHFHVTADDPSYVRPATNFLEYGVWKDNSYGPSSYVQRPPLTGLLHLFGALVSGPENKTGFFILALLFHGIGIMALYNILKQFTTQKQATVASIVFLVLPCFYGFLSYSISEALLVPLVLLAAYFHLVPQRSQLTKMASILLLLYLFRPVLLLCLLPLFIYRVIILFRKQERTTSSWPSKLLLFSLLGITIFWETRKFAYTSTLSPHPIYHLDNNSIFRPAHASLTELFKIWEYQPEYFHAFAGIPFDDDSSSRKPVHFYYTLRKLPLPEEQFFRILLEYDQVNLQSTVSKKEQHAFCKKLDRITAEVYANNKMRYWISTPFLSAKDNLKKSHLNLGIFQEKYRGTIIAESIRYGTLALLSLGYLALIVLFFVGVKRELKWLAAGAWVYFLFLIEYQRMNEDRYFLPMIVFGYIALSILTFHYSEYFIRKHRASA